jgi:hypothetical protein
MNFYSDILDVVAANPWMLRRLEFQSGLPAQRNSCFFIGRKSPQVWKALFRGTAELMSLAARLAGRFVY